MHKKAQQLVMGTTIMIFVFFLAVVLFTDYLLSTPKIDNERYAFIQEEAQRASMTITTTGYPQNWNTGNVERIGLTTNNQLNRTKIERLENLAAQTDGYDNIRQALGITNDYLLIITLPNGDEHVIGELASVQELTELEAAYIAHQSRKLIDEQTKKLATIDINIYREQR